jgi:predicted DNA-binding protein (UPF0251 family)
MMCFVVLAKRHATDVPEPAHATPLAFERMTQEQAGRSMGISRVTIQRLLMSGREKIVGAIISSKAIIFELSKSKR